MIFDFSRLNRLNSTPIDEEISFEGDEFSCFYPIKKVLSAKVMGSLKKLGDDFFEAKLSIASKCILNCSYSLEDFEYEMHQEEVLMYTTNEDLANDEVCFLDKNIYKADRIIFDLIVSNTPSKPIKPGANLPKSGKGFRVLDQDEYLKEQKEKVDPRFAKLDEIEF